MNQQYINDLAKRVHADCVAAGWWDDMNRDINQTLMLVVTEIAEATEGVRRDKMDEHLPHRKSEEVELADAAIRLADLAGRYNWFFCDPLHRPNLARQYMHANAMPAAAMHLCVVECVITLANDLASGQAAQYVDDSYSMAMAQIILICEVRDYNLQEAIEDKIAYNKTRADHKRENRAKEGGKKF